MYRGKTIEDKRIKTYKKKYAGTNSYGVYEDGDKAWGFLFRGKEKQPFEVETMPVQPGIVREDSLGYLYFHPDSGGEPIPFSGLYLAKTEKEAKRAYNYLVLEYSHEMEQMVNAARAAYETCKDRYLPDGEICAARIRTRWKDHDFLITSDCMVNRRTGKVFDIDQDMETGAEYLDSAYIFFPDKPEAFFPCRPKGDAEDGFWYE